MAAAVFDIDGRLSEGERALAVLDDYVAACQVMGLPVSVSLAELYRAESGLDLGALAADARSLDAAAIAAQDVLRLQGNGYRELTTQWSGAGGDAASGFLRTLTVAAHDVVAHLQRSAHALTTLRDALWRAVDAKVDAVLRADAQVAGRRDEWTAAARAVLGGAGDMSAASEIVDQQVKPFVLRVVYGELLPTLQDGSDAVAAEYDSAIAAVTPATVSFGLPVVMTPELARQPSFMPPGAAAYHAASTPLGALGTAATWAPSTPAMSAEPVAAPAAGGSGTPAAPAAPEPALGASAALPPPAASELSGPGLGSGVGGLGGFGQQLADAIGGVLGSVAGFGSGAMGLGGLDDIKDSLADDLGLDDENADTELDEKDEADGLDDEDDPDDDEDEAPGASPEGSPDDTENGNSAADAPGIEPVQPPPPQPAQPAPTLPSAPVVEPVEPVVQQEDPVTKTPCQIAADQLPLVGD